MTLRQTLLLSLLPGMAVLLACAGTQAQSNAGSPDEVVAEVQGARITRAEVDKRAAGTLAGLIQQEYDARRQAIDEIVNDRLLEHEAAERKMTPADLLKAEVEGKTARPTPQEIEETYKRVQSRLGGRTLDQARQDIDQALYQEALAHRHQAFLHELKAKAKVTVALAAPRSVVPLPANAPSKGPDNAAITMVEFLDYQCPYCRRAEETVDELLKRNQGKIRFVHRDFPLPGHPRAMAATQATQCAGDQGKFWEYHHGIFEKPTDYSDQDLKERATTLGLDGGAFATCLTSGRHDKEIKASTDSGNELGVNSTPTFFINGRRVTGARSVDDFQEIIDEELATAPPAAKTAAGS
jgi:protein-disulfide isomerase